MSLRVRAVLAVAALAFSSSVVETGAVAVRHPRRIFKKAGHRGLRAAATAAATPAESCRNVAGFYVDEQSAQETTITQYGCEVSLATSHSTMKGTIEGSSLSLKAAFDGQGSAMAGVVDAVSGDISVADGLIFLQKQCGYVAGNFVDNTTDALRFRGAQQGCQLSLTGPFEEGAETTLKGTVGLDGVRLDDGTQGTIDQRGGVSFSSGLYLGRCERIAGTYYLEMVMATVTQRACSVKITIGGASDGERGNWAATMQDDMLRFDGNGHDGAIKENGDIVCTNGLHLRKEMTVAQVMARGDPHLTNTKGHKFDIRNGGTYTMIAAPRGAKPAESLITIEARTKSYGVFACNNVYIEEVRMLGKWPKERACQNEENTECEGITVFAKAVKPFRVRMFFRLHEVQIKLVRAMTDSGIHYLNLVVTNLAKVGVPIGGILGEDNHEYAAENPMCERSLNLLALESKDHRNRTASIVLASM